MQSKGNSPSELWQILDNLLSKSRSPDPLKVTQEALKLGMELDTEYFLVNSTKNRMEFLTPRFISQFIISYLQSIEGIRTESLLDIWAGIGSLSAPIDKELNISKTVAIEENMGAFETGKLLKDASTFDWRLGDPDNELDKLKNTFDVIVGNPPCGMRNSEFTCKTEGRKTTIQDEHGRILILKSCQLLAKEGIGFFITTQDFVFDKDPHGMRRNLNKRGLFLEAALSLPAGWLSPLTSIPGLLLIIQKRPQNKVFLAELPEDFNSQKAVLKNLIKRQDGRLLKQGVWVDPNFDRTLEQRIQEEEIRSLAKNYPGSWVVLGDVATITLSQKGKFFDNVSNSVYLPLVGISSATTSVNELNIKPQNVAQLAFDPDQVLAPYIASFFNSPLGLMIRESESVGFIHRLSKKSVSQLTIPLPDIETQRNILNTQRMLGEIEISTEELKRKLWNYPNQQAQIYKAVQTIGRDDKFVDWVDTLPFPLASILWTYHSDNRPENQVSHLLHFFEALSQFRATIILSAYAADIPFYLNEMKGCIGGHPKHKDWYKLSTFGGWNKLGGCLASKTRTLLNNKEKSQHVSRLFGNPNSALMNAILNKKLTSTLDEVLPYRNKWKGHGGITGTKEQKRHLNLLEDKLSIIRRTFSDSFTWIDLISPINNRYIDDVYYYKVKSLTGSRRPFRKVEIRSTKPLDCEKLYLKSKEADSNALELLPLFRMMESPKTEQNACYFYSSLDDNEVRWVSYHFVTESEIIRKEPDFHEVFSILNTDELT